jgi:lipoate-protein ligase A
MLCINDYNTDPYFNLAAEEYVLKSNANDCFMLWQNAPSVIVGKHQNSLAEINLEYVKQNEIKVVRRLSGGGAVFHDLGNLNFTFIENVKGKNVIDFQKYTQPIIDVLQSLNIDAKFQGRNDLVIDGQKFSGNAEHVYRNRVLHHGTLLFASQLSDISGSLNVNPKKFDDKAVKSVRARVTNISSHLKKPISIEEFRELIFNHIINNYPDCQPYKYNQSDIDAITQLRNEKYSSWEWNFGQSPNYSMVNELKTAAGYVEVHLNVNGGIIKNIRIFGDFFNINDISDLEQFLIGCPHNENEIYNKLKMINLSDYIINMNIEEMIKVLL